MKTPSAALFSTVRIFALSVCLLSIVGAAFGSQVDQAPTRNLNPEPGVSLRGVGTGDVAIEGDWCMVSAAGYGSDDRPLFQEGAIRAFRRTASGWELVQVIRPQLLWDAQGFGMSISLSGDVLVVGAHRYGLYSRPQVSGAAIGRAYVYHLIGGVWTWKQTLEPDLSRPGGGPNGDVYGFGGVVVTDGELIAVSAMGQTDGGVGTMAGAVYLYLRDANEVWELEFMGNAPPNSQLTGMQATFGAALALEGELMAVGTEDTFAGGVVLLYRKGLTGWQFEHEFVNPSSGGHWGRHLEIDEGRVFISAVYGGLGGSPESIWIYEQGSGGWNSTVQIDPADSGLLPSSFASFGNDFAVQGDWLLVGAPGADGAVGTNMGLALLYRNDPITGWTEVMRGRNFDQPSHLPNGAGVGLRVDADFDRGVMIATGFDYSVCDPASPYYCTQGASYLFDVELGERFCSQLSHSGGRTSQLTVTGSLAVGLNRFILHGYDLPPQVLALGLFGQQGASLPVSSGGFLCLTGSGGVHRIQPAALSSSAGELYLDLDLTDPSAAGWLMPGTTWGFQVWHRDQVAGASVTNFSNGVQVQLQ